jgi:ATP-dependent helicase/DNAse subunit B
LDLRAVEDPLEGFDALQRGSLLHAILENLFNQLTERQIALTTNHLTEIAALLEDCCTRAFRRAPARYGFRPDALWKYQQAELRRMLSVLVRSECEKNGETPEFLPYRQEMRFGIQGGELPSLQVESPDGLQFYLHGVIDRLDQDASGRLRLIDYKSGSTAYSKKDIAKGLAFQTALYALAAEQLLRAQVADSYYLHIPKREPSGKLTFNSPVQADETVGAAVARAAQFVQAVRAGIFPALPAKSGTGQNGCASSCEFAALCRPDRHTFAKARRGASQ